MLPNCVNRMVTACLHYHTKLPLFTGVMLTRIPHLFGLWEYLRWSSNVYSLISFPVKVAYRVCQLSAFPMTFSFKVNFYFTFSRPKIMLTCCRYYLYFLILQNLIKLNATVIVLKFIINIGSLRLKVIKVTLHFISSVDYNLIHKFTITLILILFF